MIPIIKPLKIKDLNFEIKNCYLFFDLESDLKKERQNNFDLNSSDNKINIIPFLRNTNDKIILRCNQINSKFFKEDINFANKYKIKNIMLPYFKTIKEVSLFFKSVHNENSAMLLFETNESLKLFKKIYEIHNFKKCYFGFNDLSISLNLEKTFDIFHNKLFLDVINFAIDNEIQFGMGGISFEGDKNSYMDPKIVKKKQSFLKSKFTFLSSNFYNKINSIKIIKDRVKFLDQTIFFLNC